MSNSLGIRCYDYVEFYVGSAKMVAYWYAKSMGFNIVGYRGPETGERDRVSYYLEQNNLKFLITSSIKPTTHDIIGFLEQHGDGAKRWAVEVDDVKSAFQKAYDRGAIPITHPHKIENEHGYVEEASIRIYDDTDLVFINRDHYKHIFKPGFDKPVQNIDLSQRQPTNLQRIDHIVGNVRENEMNRWEDYMNKILDFETMLEFKPGDIATKYSALLSKVVHSKDDRIKNPINEPYDGLKKSQIEEYIEHYHGTGIQHIAIATDNIIESIKALKANGVEFLEVPDTYYETLKENNKSRKGADKVTENIDDLQSAGILCDLEGEGYLLQLFTKPIGDRPTLFFEIIQRREGAIGFGQGNFQALFDAIELDQEKRGNLVDRNESTL